MENIVSNNDWDWRMYCGNKRCNFSREFKLKDLKNFFDNRFNRQIYETNKEYDINIFSDLYDEIICENCDASPLFIINNKHEYILNPEKIIPCEKCEKPILLTRLKIKKGTKLCTPCARGKEKSEIQRIKDHNDQAIPKSPPIPDHLKICMKCGSDATTRYSVINQQWFIGCSTFPQCWWKYPLPRDLGNGLIQSMSDARYIKDASHAFTLKGTADELLEAARLCYRVKDKQILNEIFVTMKGRSQRRAQGGKSKNQKLENYILAVEKYLKEIDIDD